MSSISLLSPEIQEKIARNTGIKNLTPIQERAIPAILEGSNSLLMAQTSGGKTEAAFWPVIDQISSIREKGDTPSVYAVYLSPLTALLNDIEIRVEQYAKYIYGKSFTWHGGTAISRRKNALLDQPEILLTTPESLEVILDSGTYDHLPLLHDLRFIVIDEIHYFYETDRGAQLVALLERLADITGNDFQRIGLSATVGAPHHVLEWMNGSSERNQEIIIPDAEGKEVERNIQLQYPRDTDDDAIVELLVENLSKPKSPNNKDFKKTILFTLSREAAERWGTDLSSRLKNRIQVHHGSISQEIREEAERLIKEMTKNGPRCIVSTSTLELGIDLGDLDSIIQIGSFSGVSSFLQRIGRTGRRTNKQHLFNLVFDQVDFLKNIAIFQLADENSLERTVPSRRNYPLLAQQIFASILANYGIRPDLFWNRIHTAYPFREISEREFREVLKYNLDEGLLVDSDGVIVFGPAGEEEFSKQHWLKLYSVFEVPPAMRVIKGKTEIGTLETWWVFEKEPPFVFTLAGKRLKAKGMDFERNIIKVTDAGHSEPPQWSSSGPSTGLVVAQKIREILTSDISPGFIASESPEAGRLSIIRSDINKEVLGSNSIGIEFLDLQKPSAYLFTFAGDKLNRTLDFLLRIHTDFHISEITLFGFKVESNNTTKDEMVESITEIMHSFVTSLNSGNRLTDAPVELDKDTLDNLNKFSRYLPYKLQVQYYLDTNLDFGGLQKWLRDLLEQNSDSNSPLIAGWKQSGLVQILRY